MLRNLVPMSVIVFCLGIFASVPTLAQSPMGPGGPGGMMGQRQEQMSGLMMDMSQQMTGIGNRMAQGNLTPDQEKQMGHYMARLSSMMHRLSRMAGNPGMPNAEFQSQMGQMRGQVNSMSHQMGGMMGGSPMGPPSR